MCRKIVAMAVAMSLIITGCSMVEDVALYEIGDYLGTGETTVAGELDLVDAHGNTGSFITSNFDIKEVGESDLEQLPAYDFSGPANLGLESSNTGEEYLTVVAGESEDLPLVCITIYNDYDENTTLCPNTRTTRDSFVTKVIQVCGIDKNDTQLANKTYKNILKKIGKKLAGDSKPLSDEAEELKDYVLKHNTTTETQFPISSDKADVYESGNDVVYDVQLAYAVASGVRSRLLANGYRCTINRTGYERGQEGSTTKTKISRAVAVNEAKADLHIILDFSKDGFRVAYRDDNPDESDKLFATRLYNQLLQVKHTFGDQTVSARNPQSTVDASGRCERWDDPTLNWSDKCPTAYVSLDAMSEQGVKNYTDKDNVSKTCDAIVKAVDETIKAEE